MEVKSTFIHLYKKDIDFFKALYDSGNLFHIQIELVNPNGHFKGYKVHLEGHMREINDKFPLPGYKLNKQSTEAVAMIRPVAKRADFMYDGEKLADE